LDMHQQDTQSRSQVRRMNCQQLQQRVLEAASVCMAWELMKVLFLLSSQDSLASAPLKEKKKKHEHVKAQPVECPPASLYQLPVLATV
jgi:hypothetical protein